MSKFDTFKKHYDDAIDTINCLMTDEDVAVKHLVTWLFNTQHNPYGIFVNEQLAGAMDGAEGFASLCGAIHHALVDDGDISFPVVNGHPRIAFVCKHEGNIEKYVLTEQEKQWFNEVMPRLSSYKERLTITFLNNVFEFTKAYDAYELESLKGHFLMDAARQGVEFATKHYQDKQGFTLEWLSELPAVKEKYKGLWG